MTAPYRLRLNENAWRSLVAGRTVHTSVHGVPVEVTTDVTWNRLLAAIFDALADQNPQLAAPRDPAEAREFLTPRRK